MACSSPAFNNHQGSSMAFGDRARALQKDLSYQAGCLLGLANITAIKFKIEERKRAAVDPEIEEAVVRLGIYFEELCEGLGEPAFKLAVKQELGGELLASSEAEILAKAEARPVKTSIDKETARRLAQLVIERTQDWGD